MKKHIKEYMIHFDKLKENLDKFNMESTFCFDTESCFTSNEIKDIYENKKSKNNINGDVVRVYAWGLSNTSNDYVLYGETLDQFFKACDIICKSRVDFNQKMSENKVKEIRSKMKMNIFVHNLAWDIEFCKYYLLKNGYEYYNSKVKERKRVMFAHSEMSFNIIENNNIVYGANVNMKATKIKYRKKKKKEFINVEQDVFTDLNFLDSFKIMTVKLDVIGKSVIKIEDKFKKLGDNYDYDSVREEGHKLTEFEQMYLYNDVYILKEFINQFYLPIGTKQTTASGISFEKFIQGKYGNDKPYALFLEEYPDLYEYPKIIDIVKNSYSGGWTQVNNFYKGKHLKNINGTSIDINSSYPAVIKNKPLPYGVPSLYKGYKKCKPNELNLLVIEFDRFYNKHDINKIGVIQCGAGNTDIFGRLATEYLDTNIIDGKDKGGNYKSLNHRYRLYIWEFELENILENTVFEDYKVIETLSFKSNIGHFADVVDEYTELKISSKKEGNNAMTNFAKLVLNSFYGKLASNPLREERKVILKDGLVQNENTDIVYDADKKYYPAFASAVTAHARNNLRTTLYKLSINEKGEYENNVIYFDTDSLYTTLPLEQIKKRMGDMLDAFILGMWDIEKTYNEFKAIGSKKYIVKTHKDEVICRCAGLPENVRQKVSFDEFYIGQTFKGKLQKVKVPGGYCMIAGDYQLREQIFGGF